MPSIIHKSSVEGFGIAYLEASQFSIPSLGGKDGGASDAISHEKTGLICDGNNLDEIYSSLKSLIENKKYVEFGKNAKAYVTKFNWVKIIEEYNYQSQRLPPLRLPTLVLLHDISVHF